MRIKQLEVRGFKSFRNRTVLRFEKGSSCIVGPNGCGKSNVVDAFLWVMGEMAPKQLRGSAMEDLIFAGTDKHPPSAVAEVSLIIEYTKPQKLPSFMQLKDDFSLELKAGTEVMLTRRLDRDGKSEYLINSKPCRLKDVQEIFMDTGAGVHGFSFIEQGAVEKLISSKPEQKRTLIEAAAGISKFRSRKKEAERKLGLTETNLKRLADMLSHQKQHLEKLKRQSSKAERFTELKAEVRKKDIQIGLWNREYLQKEKQLIGTQTRQEVQKNALKKKELTDRQILSKELQKKYDLNKGKVEQAQVEAVAVATELEQKQQEIYDKREGIEKTAEKMKARYLELDTRRQDLKTKLASFIHDQAISHERISVLEEKIESLATSEGEHVSTLKKKASEVQKLKSQKIALTEELEQKNQLSFSVINSVQTLEKDKFSFEKDLQAQALELKKIEVKTGEFYSEWNSLKKLSSRLDSKEKGVQFLLQSFEQKKNFTETAASISLNSPTLEKAISSYLELRLKSVFCKKDSILPALDLLNKNKNRCRFIIPSLKAFDEELLKKQESSVKKAEGFVSILKDQIQGTDALLDSLFSGVAVVEDVSAAFRLKKQYPAWCFITKNGEVLTKEGDFIGGEDPAEEMNILTYRRAMEEMPLQYKKMKEEINARSASLKKTKSLLQENQERLMELHEQKGNMQMRTLELNKDLERVHQNYDRLGQDVKLLQTKISDCHKQSQELRTKRQELINNTKASSRRETFEQELKQVELACEKQSQQQQKFSETKDQIDKKTRDEMQILSQERQNKEGELSAFSEEQEQLREQINYEQSAVIELHQLLMDTETKINDLKLQSESISLKQTSLEERIIEKYQIDLDALETEDLALTEEERQKFNKEAEEQLLEKLISRLSSMGPVNLLALEEYEESRKKNKFYQEQYDDLYASKEKLNQVIRRIDNFCSTKFKEVFEEVNSCFSRVWPALFEGGKAKLILTKEKEIEGIDIMVQAPGKKIQNMNLLSGGEKAMTAVAFIFSIFLVKPSPFCLLDELDAPLDDVNVARFNSLLKEMAGVSQIIVITHNKYTMRSCDHLYGITMEEKGVSKIMSLNMQAHNVGGKELSPSN